MGLGGLFVPIHGVHVGKRRERSPIHVLVPAADEAQRPPRTSWKAPGRTAAWRGEARSLSAEADAVRAGGGCSAAGPVSGAAGRALGHGSSQARLAAAGSRVIRPCSGGRRVQTGLARSMGFVWRKASVVLAKLQDGGAAPAGTG